MPILDSPPSPGPGYTWDATKKQWVLPNPRSGSGQTGATPPGAGTAPGVPRAQTYGNNTSTPVSGSGTTVLWNMPDWMRGKKTTDANGNVTYTGAPELWYTSNPDRVGVDGGPIGPHGRQGTETIPGKENMRTPEQIFKQLAALSTADPTSKDGQAYKHIQDQLALVNGSKTAYRGGFMGDTEGALASAIAQWYKVEQSGVAVNFTDWLKDTAKQAYKTQQSGGAHAPASLMDPDQLAVDVQNAAQASLGHALTSAQVNAFVNEFHAQQMTSAGLEAAAGNPYYDSNRAPASAQDFIAQNFTGDVENNRLQNGMNALLGSLLTGSGAPPSTDMPSILNAPGDSGGAPVTAASQIQAPVVPPSVPTPQTTPPQTRPGSG